MNACISRSIFGEVEQLFRIVVGQNTLQLIGLIVEETTLGGLIHVESRVEVQDKESLEDLGHKVQILVEDINPFAVGVVRPGVLIGFVSIRRP